MKLLPDSHAFIWWDEDPSRLGSAASRECFDPANELILSVASVWEIQIKVMLGKLGLRKPLRRMKQKLKDVFKGKAVNKALTINTGVDEFPRYVVEYLIDNYCSEARVRPGSRGAHRV